MVTLINQDKMTAVEWLVGEIKSGLGITTVMVELAKEMEKEQIKNAFELWRTGSGEQYYNETFKSE